MGHVILKSSREQPSVMSDDPYISAAKKCDIVMKGGVTSGIVYPHPVTRLAKEYRFSRLEEPRPGRLRRPSRLRRSTGERRDRLSSKSWTRFRTGSGSLARKRADRISSICSKLGNQ